MTKRDMEDFSGNPIANFINKVSIGLSDIVFGAIDPWMDRMYYHMEVGQLNRRLALYTGFFISGYSVFWSFEYANTHSGMEAAAAIAAVLTPVNLLAGALFKFYNDGRPSVDTKAVKTKQEESAE